MRLFPAHGQGCENGGVKGSLTADANVDSNPATDQQTDAAWSPFHTVRLVVVEHKAPAARRPSRLTRTSGTRSSLC